MCYATSAAACARSGNARSRGTGRRRRRPTTYSCPTCIGTTSWASPSSRRHTSPATGSGSTACTRGSRRRFAGSTARPRFPWTSQRHAGDSYGYRFAGDGRSFVYSTDSEHALFDLEETRRFVDFFRDADLVVFDAMYSLADAISVKADWGHSSNIVGVELCQMAGARELCLFHHEPVHGDAAIERVLAEARRFEEISRKGRPLKVTAAYDGMEIAL
jgi:hypothetical protein